MDFPPRINCLISPIKVVETVKKFGMALLPVSRDNLPPCIFCRDKKYDTEYNELGNTPYNNSFLLESFSLKVERSSDTPFQVT